MMPKGVEHTLAVACVALYYIVSLPMMPKGVEHLSSRRKER